jgi:hypothetical protein
MTRFSSDSNNHTHQESRSDSPSMDEALGWEGHVNVPGSPVWAKLIGDWPELRTGLAFSMVFVVGAMVGGSVALLFGCNRSKSDN